LPAYWHACWHACWHQANQAQPANQASQPSSPDNQPVQSASQASQASQPVQPASQAKPTSLLKGGLGKPKENEKTCDLVGFGLEQPLGTESEIWGAKVDHFGANI